jgi:hypothetical protein
VVVLDGMPGRHRATGKCSSSMWASPFSPHPTGGAGAQELDMPQGTARFSGGIRNSADVAKGAALSMASSALPLIAWRQRSHLDEEYRKIGSRAGAMTTTRG